MAPAKTGGSEEGAFGKKQKNPDTNPMKDVSWPGIFSQHETNLKSHLEVIGMVKSHVAEGSDAFSAICGMVDRTNELMRQLEAVRKEFLPGNTTEKIFGTAPGGGRKRVAADTEPEDSPKRPRSSRNGDARPVNGDGQHNGGKPSFMFDSKPTQSNPRELSKNRKRPRGEEGRVTLEENNNAPPTPPAGKRKKTKSSNRNREKEKSPDEDNTAAPNPVETEDISAEVEARLMIKEATRKRGDGRTEKKRKRESLNSNADEGGSSARKPKKKKSKKGNGKDDGPESNGSVASGKNEKRDSGGEKHS